jgi:hypothetical protein
MDVALLYETQEATDPLGDVPEDCTNEEFSYNQQR